jgi:hypothetical protein
MKTFKRLEDRETLDRIKRWPSLRKRFKKVRIYSGQWQSYWRGEGSGYTFLESESNVWCINEAISITQHCGSEKQIQYVGVS